MGLREISHQIQGSWVRPRRLAPGVPMLKAVLFDVDGTIAETEEFHRRAFNEAFCAHGLGVSWSVPKYRELLQVTGGKERLRSYFDAQGVQADPQQIASLHKYKNERYASMLQSGGVQLRPGVRRLMAEAQAGALALGIATTTSAENLDALLGPLLGPQWTRQFACVVAGDQVAHKKPAPDVYLACLRALDIDPGEAIALEDSAAGVAAAQAAGIAVLVTPGLYTAEADFSHADAVVPSLGEPQMPWDEEVAGFERRWVQVGDLQRLAALRACRQIRELTQ